MKSIEEWMKEVNPNNIRWTNSMVERAVRGYAFQVLGETGNDIQKYIDKQYGEMSIKMQ